MNETIKVGQVLPDLEFEVYDPASKSFGKRSTLDLFREKKWVVFFFYPADFTFVCPTELKDLSDHYEELKRLGVEVISFSTDTKFVHLAWIEGEPLLKGVRFPMGADPTGKISRLFGVYDEHSGLARRGTFVVNPDGRLLSIEISYDNVGRNADELVRKIKAHLYLSSHPDEACPAKWRDGEKTLKPSESLVGKVGHFLNK